MSGAQDRTPPHHRAEGPPASSAPGGLPPGEPPAPAPPAVERPPVELPTPAQVEVAVGALALVADPTRLRILWLLARGDREVGVLATLTGASAAATSQHLAKLRLAGLVSMSKSGRRHVYSARGHHVRQLVEQALYFADHRVSGAPDHD